MREVFIAIRKGQVFYRKNNDLLKRLATTMQDQLNTSNQTNPLPPLAIGHIVFEEHKFKAISNNDGLLVFLNKWAVGINTYYSSIELGGKYVNISDNPDAGTYTPKVLH